MKTKIVKLETEHIDFNSIKEASSILKSGGLVAFPTETVYGLGADALDSWAAAKIYEAKGRPSDNPLIVHIAEISKLEKIVQHIPEEAKKLMEVFWPGPLTLIFEKTDCVPVSTTGGLNTVAVRMPNHKVALELIQQSTGYIAAPSANTSGKPSPTTAEHVKNDLDEKIEMILDAGKVQIGIESTIVDMTGETPVILRPGFITKTMLEQILQKEIKIDPTILEKPAKDLVPKAPGMKYKHYAPKADLVIVEGDNFDKVTQTINQLTEEKIKQGYSVGIIATEETTKSYTNGVVRNIGSRNNQESIAAAMYEILRQFDKLEVDYIYSEAFSNGDLGRAIMNRLLKAAGHQVIKV